jgi:hypothetical protein
MVKLLIRVFQANWTLSGWQCFQNIYGRYELLNAKRVKIVGKIIGVVSVVCK